MLVRTALGALALCCAGALEVRAQAPSSVSIPLQLMAVSNSYYRLAISVGINGGTPQLYMFDTGSAPFAAAFNPNTWGGFAGQTSVPRSPFPNGNNVFYCYGGGVACNTGNIYGNRLQIQSLSFSGGVTLAANPGYAVEAISQLNFGSTTYSFPSYFTNNPQAPPPFSELFGPFYGVFGAGNFTQGTLGGVLGQTIVSGVTQGYVVAANGQPNPASTVNPPRQVNGINVSVGGQTQAVTSCSPCVTVGLTPQILGQFAPVGSPGVTGQAGVVPVPSSSDSFNNPYVPYGTARGNNGSTQYGAKFTVSLTAPGTSTPAVSSTNGTLLDTGTPSNYLSDKLDNPAVATNDGNVKAGVTLTAVATTGDGSGTPVTGLTTSTAVLTKGATPNTYDASFSNSAQGIIGIGFFLQNSVMYDLSDNVIAYTPFFVSDAALATTANGPLIVDGTNVPLGLAGVVSGPGGVRINSGGALQLSATNTYTGATQIASGGQLLVSGPGSIASSSGVANDGVFDISRAWASVSIQALTGSGETYLGGNNLAITNASGTFAGSIKDGGSYPVGGGSLTIAGGTQALSGVNTYTGSTVVLPNAQLNITGGGSVAASAGVANFGRFDISGATAPVGIQALAGTGRVDLGGNTLILTNASTDFSGVIADGGASGGTGGSLTVAGGTQMLSGASTYTGPTIVSGGQLVLNGSVTSNVAVGGMGLLSGTGTIFGNLVNAGVVAPGTVGSTLSVGGNYGQAAGGVYYTQVNAAGQSSRLAVAGTANLQGGTVLVGAQAGPYAARTTYNILRADGGVTGTYGSVVGGSQFLIPSLSYDANDIFLTLQAGGFAVAAQTVNQRAVGAVLDASASTASGDFSTVIGTLSQLSAPQVATLLTSLGGQSYANLGTFNTQTAAAFMSAVGTQLQGLHGGLGGSGTHVALAASADGACDVTCEAPTEPPRFGAWLSGVGGMGSALGSANAGTLTYNFGGTAVGTDYRVRPDLLVGVGAGYVGGTQWVGGFAGQANTDAFSGSLYASYTPGPAYLDGLVGYGYAINRMTRVIAIPGMATRTALGTTGANQVLGQLEGGWRFGLPLSQPASVTPFVRLQGSTTTQNGFTESGAQSLNLVVQQQTVNSLRSTLGADLSARLARVTVGLRLGWQHEYADTNRPMTASFSGAPGTPFTVYGATPQRDSAVLGLAASTRIAEATDLYVRYDGEVGGGTNNNAFTAGLRMTW